MNHTYYYIGSSAEVEAILRNGFIDNELPSIGRRGVYVADSPGEPDRDYPDGPLLEIILPADIDACQWEVVPPKAPPRPLGYAHWREWLIPARILNQYGKIRPLRKDQWDFLWAKYNDAKKRRLTRLMNPDYLSDRDFENDEDRIKTTTDDVFPNQRRPDGQ
jgi:hypothetical protein